MRFLVIFIFIVSTAIANEVPNIKNLVIKEEPRMYSNIAFLDDDEKIIRLSDYEGNLVILNFWATWCAPCNDEMPSLDLLKTNEKLDNLKIFPINVGKDNLEKSIKFFEDLKIKNLNVYFDSPNTLAKKLGLRGIPTTILINKNGLEFARIIGSIDFENEKFINWLSSYN